MAGLINKYLSVWINKTERSIRRALTSWWYLKATLKQRREDKVTKLRGRVAILSRYDQEQTDKNNTADGLAATYQFKVQLMWLENPTGAQ